MIIGAKIVMISSKPRVCSFNRWAIFEPFSNLEKAVFVVFGRLRRCGLRESFAFSGEKVMD